MIKKQALSDLYDDQVHIGGRCDLCWSSTSSTINNHSITRSSNKKEGNEDRSPFTHGHRDGRKGQGRETSLASTSARNDEEGDGGAARKGRAFKRLDLRHRGAQGRNGAPRYDLASCPISAILGKSLLPTQLNPQTAADDSLRATGGPSTSLNPMRRREQRLRSMDIATMVRWAC
ncbi:hypothetical protein PC9H_009183 [Pleurotus ostreatus]|uniref:Uncharacterized protein n=1 Tax=Pleurotus ostreatus TaxID=5322 RepID=A0A8H6ZSP5_PLEOS|nr:uncharacterized protein PC9H_009183 [Pleurotus ostreatus]KAF7426814.1 hypothetical protein PC9H_009183 [Pleurotus ostreatus]